MSRPSLAPLFAFIALAACDGLSSAPADAPAVADGPPADGAQPGPDAPSGPLDECSDHDDCAVGLCRRLPWPWGTTVCADLCSAPEPDCPDGFGCYIPGDIAGWCLPTCAATCSAGLTCYDGFCVPAACALTPAQGCCFDDVVTTCGDGYRCYGASCAGERPGRCLPIPEGGRCWFDTDCVFPDGRCLGAELVPVDSCSDPVSAFGEPGTCSSQ